MKMISSHQLGFNTMLFVYLLLWATMSGVISALDLSQSDSVIVRPGETFSLNCKITGYSVSDGSASFATGWIRQPEGRAMEWISHIWDDGDIFKHAALGNKFSISRDAASNSVSLKGQSVQAEDTAVYYCARCKPQ